MRFVRCDREQCGALFPVSTPHRLMRVFDDVTDHPGITSVSSERELCPACRVDLDAWFAEPAELPPGARPLRVDVGEAWNGRFALPAELPGRWRIDGDYLVLDPDPTVPVDPDPPAPVVAEFIPDQPAPDLHFKTDRHSTFTAEQHAQAATYAAGNPITREMTDPPRDVNAADEQPAPAADFPRPPAPADLEPARKPHARKKPEEKRTCVKCGHEGFRKFKQTPRGWLCGNCTVLAEATSAAGPPRASSKPAIQQASKPAPATSQVTAKCQDCPRSWILTGRVLKMAAETHELKHSHVVDIFDSTAKG